MKIGFIGIGNMAKAGLLNLLNSGLNEKNIIVTSPSIKNTSCFQLVANHKNYDLQVAKSNKALIQLCDLIILGFKPYQMDQALNSISEPLDNKCFISVLAGVSIDSIAQKLNINPASILRLMPNTPCAIGQGIGAGYMKNSKPLSIDSVKQLEKISQAFCCPISLDKEEKLNAITAISGSGVAYVYLLSETILTYWKNTTPTLTAPLHKLDQAFLTHESITPESRLIKAFKLSMKQWANTQCLDEKHSNLLVEQTFIGAYALIKNATTDSLTLSEVITTIKHLREKVTSKKGTTFAALEQFEKNNNLENLTIRFMNTDQYLSDQATQPLKQLITDAMNAAYKRSIEISQA